MGLLNQIEAAKELTPMLVRRLIDLAHLFTLKSVGRTLSQGHFPKFDRLLTKIRMISGLDPKKLVGLCFAMTLSRGEAIEALPAFVKGVPKEELAKVRLELQHHLGKVHRNPLVPRWINENYDILDRNLLPVIEYANDTMSKFAFSMMTMALLCELPDDLDDLAVLADNLDLSNQSDILNVSLGSFPR